MGIESGGKGKSPEKAPGVQAEMSQFLLRSGEVGRRAFADHLSLTSHKEDEGAERKRHAQEVAERRATDPQYDAAFLTVKELKNALVGEISKEHQKEKPDRMLPANEATRIMEAVFEENKDSKDSDSSDS